VTTVRVSGTCGKGATSRLELRQDGSGIAVEFDAGYPRSDGVWRVVVVQEGRVVWRTHTGTRGSGGSLRVTRTIGALRGADRVTARATGPRGITCVASAVLPG
jgi:hypothetical protein